VAKQQSIVSIAAVDLQRSFRVDISSPTGTASSRRERRESNRFVTRMEIQAGIIQQSKRWEPLDRFFLDAKPESRIHWESSGLPDVMMLDDTYNPSY
jgi:hypothetical protein